MEDRRAVDGPEHLPSELTSHRLRVPEQCSVSPLALHFGGGGCLKSRKRVLTALLLGGISY